MSLRRLETRLEGLVLLEPAVHTDERGRFLETYSRDRYRELGVDADFVQDNLSRSRRGTIRALHFQIPPGQAKLVQVVRGAVFDVAVDLRRSSPTYGEWESFDLTDENSLQLYLPIGFAHGFCAVSDVADVAYKTSTYYDPDADRGIAYDDPALAIPWPIEEPLVSDRDRANPRLEEIAGELRW